MLQQSSYGFALVFRPYDLRPEIYNTDFHSDGLLDADVREVRSF